MVCGIQTSVFLFPEKVDLTFDSIPIGLTLELDGVSKITPFTYDTLIGFEHVIEAPDQSSGITDYTFDSWSDGGTQSHVHHCPGK